MFKGRSLIAPTALLRPTWSERCFVLCAPAALAAGFGALAGPTTAAVAGAAGAVLGFTFAALADRRAAAAGLDLAALGAEYEALCRTELRTQLVELVGEAARTSVEFERRAAFAEDARRAQNQLLAELAPEFYGLLRSMGHHAEQLRSAELDADETEAVESLCESTAALRRLLGAVLDLARARAGRLRLRERDFDLAAALERIGRSFESAARAKGVDFQRSIGRLGNHWRFGDERRLQQLLERVLGAALDTTERGSIELTVAESPERPDRLRFEVRDAAPVHDQASFERILTESSGTFENLFELDASLSLALARGLAEVLGGRLEAHTRPEGGHVIAVELPLPTGANPRTEAKVASADGVGLRAIVAVPEGADGDLVESVALGLGWSVQRCTNGDVVGAALTESGGADVLIVSSALDEGHGVDRLADWTSEWPGATAVLVLDTSVPLDPSALARCGARRSIASPPNPGLLRNLLADLVLAGGAGSALSTRVLLACDDDLTARLESLRLSAAGHVVDRVRTHDELVSAFQDAVYGLVVVDTRGDPAVLAAVARRLDVHHGMSGGPFKIRELAGGNMSVDSLRASVRSDTCLSVGSHNEDLASSHGAHAVTDPNPRSAIDAAVIQSLKELGGDEDPRLLEELIGMFMGDAPARLEKLVDAVDRSDFAEAGRIAHALKSSCGNLGALAMAELCRTIEQSCRTGTVDSVPALVTQSRAEFERVCNALSEQLG